MKLQDLDAKVVGAHIQYFASWLAQHKNIIEVYYYTCGVYINTPIGSAHTVVAYQQDILHFAFDKLTTNLQSIV